MYGGVKHNGPIIMGASLCLPTHRVISINSGF